MKGGRERGAIFTAQTKTEIHSITVEAQRWQRSNSLSAAFRVDWYYKNPSYKMLYKYFFGE
jgi:hypothetical protein